MTAMKNNRRFKPKNVHRAGRLFLDGHSINGVRAEIEVPERDEGQLQAILRWAYNAPGPRTGPGRFTFETGVDTTVGAEWSHERVELDDLHVYAASPIHLTTSAQEIRAEADVMQLTITRKRSINGPIKGTLISVFVTPNRLLSPWRSVEMSYRGTVKMGRGAPHVVVDPALGRIAFDDFYEWDSSEDDAVRQSRRYLTANLSHTTSVEDKEGLRKILALLDDLLLLYGFVTRTPMRAAGWTASSNAGQSEHYRRDMRLPDGRQRYRTIANGGLTERARLTPFVRSAIRRFRKSAFQDQLRNAFWALEKAPEETVGQKFISLFSAFEGLMDALIANPARKKLDADKRARDLVRGRLISDLAVAVKKARASAEMHAQFAGAINNVQSLSFAEKVRLLQATTKIELDDIWPVVAPGNVVSLYRIRNLLAHGRPVEMRHFDAVIDAGHHIEWALERLVCLALDWPLTNTDISPTALPNYWVQDLLDWKAAEKSLRS